MEMEFENVLKFPGERERERKAKLKRNNKTVYVHFNILIR